ncbi:WGR domain-containing protein [Bradyrhizobium sp. CB1015]|uniref:WGR domain-containing protein n=1 Tax=Bradyrhizobium sp. CB1015 TaxID=2976822 RepID=UPI000F53734B|nr:WGR domain-containing protein [Bradyrhizobium sp. CB1015]RQH02242.1 WGR domain-containing protein [Bradyrhizobium sp. RP6]UWU93580.1 WGR domain-containing protein [Bradyrhizobium sp. CB1015]
MRRFYLLSTQPTLFGGVSLIRKRGRIGTTGQTMVQTPDKAVAPSLSRTGALSAAAVCSLVFEFALVIASARSIHASTG